MKSLNGSMPRVLTKQCNCLGLRPRLTLTSRRDQLRVVRIS